ncbi:MAG: peptidase domain-containing ABC transporter [Oscillibacter sp.]|nr:peptidase domain-containing ABC transporter [Oscillibacter sp.]
MKHFPIYIQSDAMDCGPACLQMIAKYFGRYYSLPTLRESCFITREGVSLGGISEAAEKIGLRTIGARCQFEDLLTDAPLPFIAFWNQEHFVVVYKIKNGKVWIADPGHGKLTYTTEQFKKCWISTVEGEKALGVILLLEPTPDFYNATGEKIHKNSLNYLLGYLSPYKKFIIQLVLGLLLGSILQLIAPFLTQSVVDIGIQTSNLRFVHLVLIAQLVLIASRLSVDFIRSWILLHISTRINISLISDFLIKLMKLPIRFFDTKMIGDIIQRIGDHSRIENFLTSQTLSVLFSMFNLLIFGLILIIYNIPIFFVFLTGSALYFVWVYLFMKKRRDIDYKRFAQMAMEQSNLFQLITGMQEIKLNNCERRKRWEWERIQARLFKVNVQSLSLSQYQQMGALFFNETKNILITIMAATAVIKGEMTLGMMLAVQYIVGQLNSPVEQMLSFIQGAQDAKISLDRLGEIHDLRDEEPEDKRLMELPAAHGIKLNNLSFQYDGPHALQVLREINLEIPEGKITAIVGASGSGKTTLVKLMLGFYSPVEGQIFIGDTSLDQFNQSWWRQHCGVVMQDGFIFSDTIARNIAVSDEVVDKEKLLYAVKIANIQEYIESLPLKYNTKIGQEGVGLSQGQKQRLLIARAVYKNPDFIFLDEATNALDADNERTIMENLNHFFHGRTVIVVAHRLSTVKNADQIIVLDKGEIVERGTHKELTEQKGMYYNLVKNQLELGS